MVVTPASTLHSLWGRPISIYPALYINSALADRFKLPVKANDRAASRTIALRTIEKICALNESKTKPSKHTPVFDRITLSNLESILELTWFPDEYESLALPRLIAGCIELLTCITSSPFAYEYGYLCFRILIFSLNTCLLKYGGTWKETIELMESQPPEQRLSCFWNKSTSLLSEEMLYYSGEELTDQLDSIRQRRWSIPSFDQGKLDKLLSILHSDRKNFFISIRDSGSLGLSALFFVIWEFIRNKRSRMNEVDYEEKELLPFCRILHRYQLVSPDLGCERVTSRLPFSTDMVGLQDEGVIDLDDSRNILKAYIVSARVPLGRSKLVFRDLVPLGFFAPLVVSECEDLIPEVFNATIDIFWNAIPTNYELHNMDHFLRHALNSLGCILHRLERPTTRRGIKPSCIHKLTDSVIDHDLVGLILRSTLLKPEPDEHDLKGECETNDNWTCIQQFLNLATFSPPDYTLLQIVNSGAHYDWVKYYTHLVSLSQGRLDLEPTDPKFTMQGYTAQLLRSIAYELMGNRLENDMTKVQDCGQTCNNPRCAGAAPFGYGYAVARSKRVPAHDLYCGPGCLEIHQNASAQA